jgi:peptide/nickel transport system substrate-binding protein
MRKTAFVLVGLLLCCSLAFSGGSGEVSGEVSTEAGAAPAGEALGLYPEYFQFDTLTQFTEVTGNTISSFGEAPILATMVANGELPPVEERLPEEPLVIVRNEIGKYGGTLRTAHDGSTTDVIIGINKFMEEMPYTYDPDYVRVGSNVVQQSELQAGGTEFIWRLRKGMRWSDGAPMTADDFMFWYDAVATNKELSPAGIRPLKLQGIMGEMAKLDEYSLKITFPSKFGYFPEQIALFRPTPWLPKHYMSQFHPDYTSAAELDKTMKQEGFTDWVSLWTAKRTWWAVENPDMPHIRPWLMQTDGRAHVNTMVRNPYYWKIDTAGNQLPYIDGVESVLVGDQEGKKLAVIAGDIDYISGSMVGMTAETYALLKENESKGDYRVVTSRGVMVNQGAVNLNLSHPDPVLSEIFMQKNFRIALSLAIDRDEVNEVIHRGSFVPSQTSPNTEWGTSDFFKQYLEYDPDEANRLLDELGLQWNSDNTVRLRPDGKPMRFVMHVLTARGPWMVDMAEMYKQYYAAIGIEVSLKPGTDATFPKLRAEGQYDMLFHQSFGGMKGAPAALRGEVMPLSLDRWQVNPAWGRWIQTNGEEGVEPPDDVKRLGEITNEFLEEPDPARRTEIEEEIFRIHMDNLWTIGGMNTNPNLNFSPFSNRIRNQVGTVWATYHHVPSAWYIDE